MSNFVVNDEDLNKDRRYRLDSDLKRGMFTAIRNNQLALAFEYLAEIMDIVDEKLGTKSTTGSSNESKKPVTKKASTTAKPLQQTKTTADKTEDESS